MNLHLWKFQEILKEELEHRPPEVWAVGWWKKLLGARKFSRSKVSLLRLHWSYVAFNKIDWGGHVHAHVGWGLIILRMGREGVATSLLGWGGGGGNIPTEPFLDSESKEAVASLSSALFHLIYFLGRWWVLWVNASVRWWIVGLGWLLVWAHITPGKVLLLSDVKDISKSLACSSSNTWYIKKDQSSIKPESNQTAWYTSYYCCKVNGKGYETGGMGYEERPRSIIVKSRQYHSLFPKGYYGP